jgi:hypothetical protein
MHIDVTCRGKQQERTMISPIHAQPSWRLEEPAALACFKSVSGMDSETEIIECLAHASANIVTDNKDPAGSYLVKPESIDWASHTRPFNDGLILYNGHAGLGETTAVCMPGKPEIPNLVDCPAR